MFAEDDHVQGGSTRRSSLAAGPPDTVPRLLLSSVVRRATPGHSPRGQASVRSPAHLATKRHAEIVAATGSHADRYTRKCQRSARHAASESTACGDWCAPESLWNRA